MKAIIVAAGRSSRLYPLTLKVPKPLLRLNGKTIIEHSISNLHCNGIKDIAIVVGYRKEQFYKLLKDKVTFITNPYYESTNDMFSLFCARNAVKEEDFLYLHGDLVYHPDILTNCLKMRKKMVLVIEEKRCDEEDMKVKVKKGVLIESSKQIPLEQAYGEWIGIAKFSAEKGQMLFDEIETILENGKNGNRYDTYAFTALANKREKIYICHTNGLPWIEIDFIKELDQAKRLFNSFNNK